MPDLKRYREKRDPEKTPEPFGVGDDTQAERNLAPGAARSFVVQQHAARALHWDLRLEIDGVLASWAVPRGPTLDPGEKRLAVRTEDHPIEYADFEGVIPEGNYGAGAMIVWDSGVYRTVDGQSPAQGVESGKLDLALDGHKLRGRFALVQTKQAEGKNWLLLRKGDPPPDGPDIVEAMPRSVLSGLTVEELRDGASARDDVVALAQAHGEPASRLDPAKLRPMLAATEEEPFSRDGWIFELKYDGMRLLATRRGDDVRLATRSGRDVTVGYPEIARALRSLPLDAFVLDGELVAPDERGHGSFERLQRRFTRTGRADAARARTEIPVRFHVFDLLAVEDFDLRRAPLERRKEILAAFVPGAGRVCLADHIEREGEALFEVARDNALEGIVAKRLGTPYRTGRRSDDWRKVKVPRAAPLAIAGWLPGKGTRSRLGSLMLAWRQSGRWVYAGNVGSGLGEATIDDLLPELEAAERDAPVFETDAKLARGARFCDPVHVAQVRFTEVTSGGMLRHPVFAGLRDDLAPEQCEAPIDRDRAVEDAPEPAPDDAPTLQVSRREKVFWPDDGFTKGDLLDYYEAAWPWIGPYLADRPVVLTRYPDGIEGKSFFQQNAPDWTPAWARREHIDGTDFYLCNDLQTLLHVVNSGAIPLHVWGSRVGRIDHPDWLSLDLDPKEAPFEHVVDVARHIHRLLDELGAPHHVKTSGQAGLHILIPLDGRLDHDETRSLAEVLARVVCSELPEIATITRPVAARGDRVYVDFGQNGRGRLLASAFSVRPRPGAPVSTPLRWSQVTRRLKPARFNLRTTVRAMERDGDPMRGLLEGAADVGALLDALVDRLGGG